MLAASAVARSIVLSCVSWTALSRSSFQSAVVWHHGAITMGSAEAVIVVVVAS